ncbi:maleylacetate reductase [Phaeobacter sp. QD34_3]|uniref:maleylacetate reductase n=1 Tax=unclassified Phaeobacter TaxID=2621772 RepID=UPI00237FA136|nr:MULTISPECIES: maleylacetate reductase [unclassified Phaeobacter]MDE4133668.1 maleylacetate reductase [Phaeobacter sp. QD34_3]MDE4137399.1 maleylacetate reductase [Phaeobacter sp. QD34_24]
MSYFQKKFVANSAAMRVRFGPGVRHQVAEEIHRLGARRALILSTPQQADAAMDLAEDVGALAAGLFSRATMHTPIDVTTEALAHAREIEADCLIAVGGGSTTGLSKAIAYRTDLPQIVVPTTYAGSEATPILGQTEAGRKVTLTDPKVQPEVILYDAELITSLPVAMTVTSALNAIAHAAEALYARDRNPLSTALAVEGMRAFAESLPRVIQAPDRLDARGETLYGAWLCGTVLGQVGMALHHKLCHTLGGSFDLPHAETHAIILPHAIAYNAAAVPDLLTPVTEIFGGETPGAALHGFAAGCGAPLKLADLGLASSDLDRAADLATQNAYWNPAEIDRDAIRHLLEAAYCGRPPGS